MSKYEYQFVGTNDIRFVSAISPVDKIRFILNLNNKRVGSLPLTAVTNQVVSTNRADVLDGTGVRVGSEDLTARTYYSGSIENREALKKHVLRHTLSVLTTLDRSASGFKPGIDANLNDDLSIVVLCDALIAHVTAVKAAA